MPTTHATPPPYPLAPKRFGADLAPGTAHFVITFPCDLDTLTRDLVVAALELTHGVQTHAAALLGISPRQIDYQMQKWGLPRPTAERNRRQREAREARGQTIAAEATE